jgi:hypothetical protein
MKHSLVFPDYNRSILNITASILQAYGLRSNYPPLPSLDPGKIREKNIVINYIMDGLGYNIYQKYTESYQSHLAQFLRDRITSVFPSTTTAAITSMRTGLSPYEHGALGWSLYFKEFFSMIDFLPHTNSLDNAFMDPEKYDSYSIMNFPSLLEEIGKKNDDLLIYNLMPKAYYQGPYSTKMAKASEIIPYESINDLNSIIEHISVSDSDHKKFIMIYSPQPDATLHKSGTTDQEVYDTIHCLDMNIKQLETILKDKNGMLIISADHGLIDIKEYDYINDDEELYDCLILPTFPESRFLSFFIKAHKKEQFLHAIRKYQDHYLFLSREELFQKEFLGFGKMHKKVDDFIGDYVAIAVSDHAMKTVLWQSGKKEKEFKAHHSGLTADEMLVPLFIIEP